MSCHLLLPLIPNLEKELMSYRDFPFPDFILTAALILHYEQGLTLVSFYFLIFSSSNKNVQASPHSSLC